MSARVAARRLFTTSARRFQQSQKQELTKETKRNPELMVRHNLWRDTRLRRSQWTNSV
jgi:hypothetical protein